MPEETSYNFEISLSVLNHLGRNLYRNFITVLGEAISNSWDADANNVWITIDRENSTFTIKDDGIGMTEDEFQNCFLKIGYSKRKDGTRSRNLQRPYIGAKGIGKLALLSCAERVSVFTKTENDSDYTGGVIDNSGLDEAIKEDLTPDKYPLEPLDLSLIEGQMVDHAHGTIIHFDQIKERIRNTVEYQKKLLAMTFRFSLLDKNFNIYVNDALITIEDLKDLSSNTQLCWIINGFSDDFVNSFNKLRVEPIQKEIPLSIKGFLATTIKPRHLNISGAEERSTIDLFVNGRLREKNILRHIPTQRILESYIYGQTHYDEMHSPDGDPFNDPFTSIRELIKEENENFKILLDYLGELIRKILDEWDELRIKFREDGDNENTRVTKRERGAMMMVRATVEGHSLNAEAPNKDQVDRWLEDMEPDADFNALSYVDCFLSENLVRTYIRHVNTTLNNTQEKEAEKWRRREDKRKGKANISFQPRQNQDDLSLFGYGLFGSLRRR